MKKVLLINAGVEYGFAQGKLNTLMTEVAKQTLSGHYKIIETHLKDSYDIETEVNKFIEADFIIWQFPAYWMSTPWQLKKYVDDVLSACHSKLYTGDGRTRSDQSKKYGSGGIDFNKHYMLSTTWNAPANVFNNPDTFFEGKSFDEVFFWFHKTNQFIGLKKLESFSSHDVVKNPQIETDKQNYIKHLKKVFNIK